MKKNLALSLTFASMLMFILFGGCSKDDGPTEVTEHFADQNWAAADLLQGGQLYDKWWVVNNGATPTTDFDPIWSSQTTNTRTGADTWRCKECHGWDYQGEDGAYGSGSHYTGFEGVWAARLLDKTVVFDSTKGAGGDHDFSEILSDVDVLDLTKFIIDGQIDMSLYIDYNKKASLGDPVAGESLYTANCSVCHGAGGIYGNNLLISDLANDNPWETLHKIRFGHPGSLMPSMVENGRTNEEISNILAYCQGL